MSAILKEIRVFESGFHTTNFQTNLPHKSTAALYVGLRGTTDNTNPCTDGKSNVSCIYCKGPHPAHTCEVITDYQT